ncbi:hypothetical protein [Peribacillus frigoritolerans]
MSDYQWGGSQKHYVDEVHTELLNNDIVIGHFGGNSQLDNLRMKMDD